MWNLSLFFVLCFLWGQWCFVIKKKFCNRRDGKVRDDALSIQVGFGLLAQLAHSDKKKMQYKFIHKLTNQNGPNCIF